MSGSGLTIAVELDAVQDIRRDLESAGVRTVEQLCPKGLQPDRIVELVAVDAEDPGVRARIRLDQAMRLPCMGDAASIDMVMLPPESAQDLPGSIGRDMIDRMDVVAEVDHVSNRLLDEQVLVMDEDDAYDSGCYPSS